ncbi:Metallo-dependent hydrolase [Dentipellis sp. KUC8613]|nr:Metallo-dependent hydrolase [Dentipellis sp. KUC8613]
MSTQDVALKPRSLLVRNVHLPATSRGDALYDVYCKDGKVHSVSKSSPACSPLARVLRRGLGYFLTPEIDAEGKGLLLPSLCHAHIHIDKCFLLDQCGKLESGTFQEALALTTRAKAQFPEHLDDVYARGRRLIVDSLASGVTAMRAHVEVDTAVQLACLDVALRLKAEFAAYCDIQISAFAQDPLFESPDAAEPGANYALLRTAARTPGVACVGSAPYVERTPAQAAQNIALLVALARAHDLHADFHLDYNIDAASAPLVYVLLQELRARGWPVPEDAKVPGQHTRMVTIGHGTRYTLFDGTQWDALRAAIGALPVAFVALPQSDMYMMGKGGGGGGDGRDGAQLPPRATLPVPYMASRGLRVALSVNNVDNAFTPQGSVDPMGLCPLGVAVYQDAGEEACRVLLAAVSSGARRAVGLTSNDEGRESELEIKPGDQADFVLLHDNPSARSAVLDPCYTRSTIRAGRVIATRRGARWACFDTRPAAAWEEGRLVMLCAGVASAVVAGWVFARR